MNHQRPLCTIFIIILLPNWIQTQVLLSRFNEILGNFGTSLKFPDFILTKTDEVFKSKIHLKVSTLTYYVQVLAVVMSRLPH